MCIQNNMINIHLSLAAILYLYSNTNIHIPCIYELYFFGVYTLTNTLFNSFSSYLHTHLSHRIDCLDRLCFVSDSTRCFRCRCTTENDNLCITLNIRTHSASIYLVRILRNIYMFLYTLYICSTNARHAHSYSPSHPSATQGV